MSAPGSSGAPARSDALCGRRWTSTDERSHTRSKLETTNPAPGFRRVGPGRLWFVILLLTPCKTCKAANVFPVSVPPQGSREVKEFRVIQIGHHPVRRLRAVPVEDLVALRVLFPNGVIGRTMIGP